MNDLVETIEYRGHKINIYLDESAESPDNWDDDERFIVYDHRQFYVARKGFDPTEIFQEFKTKKTYNGYWIFPLYAYIHSGVSLSLGRGYDPWDTSFKGFVLIKRQAGSWTKELARKQAEGLVENWNYYLDGTVYGYATDTGDSCWGYYGDYRKSGIIEEAKAEIDYAIKKKLSNHFKRLKAWIRNKVPVQYRQPVII